MVFLLFNSPAFLELYLRILRKHFSHCLIPFSMGKELKRCFIHRTGINPSQNQFWKDKSTNRESLSQLLYYNVSFLQERKKDKKANNESVGECFFFFSFVSPYRPRSRRNMSEHHKQFSTTQIFPKQNCFSDIEKCCFTLSVWLKLFWLTMSN